MEAQRDFSEWLALLNERKVEYLVVGAYALAFHGSPRFTGDLDVYLRPSIGNAHKVMGALAAFGFGSLGLAESDFTQEGQVIQLGAPPVRIDLLTSITGVSWDEADQGKVSGQYGDVSVFYLGSRNTSSINGP
jgi:hypothetical protein